MADLVEEIKVPLKLRLRAWWHGYDLEDIKLRLMAQAGAAMSDTDILAAIDKDKAQDQTGPDTDKTSALPWDKIRVEMTQLIWGDGYCGPGGRKHVIDMCKLLSMDSKMSAIVIGAGLGGPARVLTEEFGVWITGYEQSPELSEQANELSKKAGLEKKVIVHPFDPAKASPFDRKYERALSKEALYCFPDKDKVIKETYNTLKDNALFLLTDYVLSDISSLENPDVQKWLKQEAFQPYPVPSKNITTALEKAGFTIRVNEDVSKEYVELIEQSWAKAKTVAEHLTGKGPEGLAAVKTLMVEAEFWALRAKLIKSGLIGVHRFLAHKPAQPL
ncbi:SAM-dependent methyltransferase [Paremcibacter congregatus]|uniref:SAM-dependent methyltransferase n=1 Tax=Paremcibacter congregatus TaxID=2043170 RepID=UPI0030ED089E|tara:strand:+ start:814 stop:1806 length:993 start_codon:yes stop_codon:yes gene_type:complete